MGVRVQVYAKDLQHIARSIYNPHTQSSYVIMIRFIRAICNIYRRKVFPIVKNDYFHNRRKSVVG